MTDERPSIFSWFKRTSDPQVVFYSSVPAEPIPDPGPPRPIPAPAPRSPDAAVADEPPPPFSHPKLGPDRKPIIPPTRAQDPRVLDFYRALTDRKGRGREAFGTKKLDEIEAPGSTLVRITFDPRHEKVHAMGLEWVARAILKDLLEATRIVLGVEDYVGALVPRSTDAGPAATGTGADAQVPPPLQIVLTARDQQPADAPTALLENRNL